MTRLEHIQELLGDIRDCASRTKDLGFPEAAVDLFHVADCIQVGAQAERPSLPPVLASNQETRAKAEEHFRAARKILKGIL